MDFRLLGPLDVADHERALALGGVKPRSSLALLLLHASDVVSTERSIDELLRELPPATVAKSVQTCVSRLRKEVPGGRPMTRPRRYVLRVGPGDLASEGTRMPLGWSLTGAGA
jgi:DNA-binding SARP family transcriptional activator